MPLAQTLSSNNVYNWYQCNCCPYGYHIDLDFVRYCETIGQQVERSGSIKRRKDRRRQRQSMDMLLGLASPLLLNQSEAQLAPIQDLPRSPLIQDALDDVVSDFERTLQRTKNKLSNNLPDVTAVSENQRVPSVLSMSSTNSSSMTILHSSGEGPGVRDFDTVSIESCGLSPAVLQNVREQMALSLERTKELEEKVKLLPTLKAQLSSLKEENKQLLQQLRAEEENKLNRLNSNYLFNSYSRNRSQSFDDGDGTSKKQPPPPPPRRDFGVMAGVLTRNVGVGHQSPHTKSVSTGTQQDQHVDRWFDEKNKFLNGINTISDKNKIIIDKGTQTIFPKEKRDFHTQTLNPTFKESAVNATVISKDVHIQNTVEMLSIGTSDHTVDDSFCAKCNVSRNTIGVGTTDILQTSISLAALSVPRSKSFHLGEEKLNLTRSRTVGCQYDLHFMCNKSVQSEIKTVSNKHSQHDIVLAHKNIQYEHTGLSKSTDTDSLKPVMKDKACECVQDKAKTTETACNTHAVPPASKEPCTKCGSGKEEEVIKRDESTTPSRIPRPQIPTTPVENRKFKRQDTYTKIPASPGLSALELLPTKTTQEVCTFDKVKQTCKLPETKTKHEIATQEEKKVQPTVSETTLCQPPSPRKKCTPSKEMQAAMKVLHDSLQKHHGRDVRGQLKNANAIVEAEWFRISSIVKADPVDVEDYLDSFEDVSSNLLEYIVNMVDASGNTAMHYAVSHGNFDVVSILLDSKVCDINKQNKAGYTSVMLVSLAEVRSQTHANVVRRLFSLADVNIRAKQHGQTALMLAVSHGRLDMVSMLLEAGADINIQDEDGSTALMCAAEHGHVDIVKHFLSHPDCDSSISDVDGSTALKIAMEAGHRHIGVLLYAHERNLHGGTPARPKKTKSTSASPKTPSSPLMQRSVNRALSTNK